MIHLIEALFWLGLIICVAIFVFKVVVTVFFIVTGALIAGIASLWDKLTNNEES